MEFWLLAQQRQSTNIFLKDDYVIVKKSCSNIFKVFLRWKGMKKNCIEDNRAEYLGLALGGCKFYLEIQKYN